MVTGQQEYCESPSTVDMPVIAPSYYEFAVSRERRPPYDRVDKYFPFAWPRVLGATFVDGIKGVVSRTRKEQVNGSLIRFLKSRRMSGLPGSNVGLFRTLTKWSANVLYRATVRYTTVGSLSGCLLA
jgi:hypothetical protein